MHKSNQLCNFDHTKNENKMENQDALNQFIINVKLVDPINNIVTGLNAGTYRDCDIKWLDNKLEAFISFAAETLGVKGLLPSNVCASGFTVLNDYNKQYYLSKFTTLLEYFKSL